MRSSGAVRGVSIMFLWGMLSPLAAAMMSSPVFGESIVVSSDLTIQEPETYTQVMVVDSATSPNVVAMIGGTVDDFILQGQNVLDFSAGSITGLQVSGTGQANLQGGIVTQVQSADSGAVTTGRSLIYGELDFQGTSNLTANRTTALIYEGDGEHVFGGHSVAVFSRAGTFGNRFHLTDQASLTFNGGRLDRLVLEGSATAELRAATVRQWVSVPSANASLTIHGYNMAVSATEIVGNWAHGERFTIPLLDTDPARIQLVTTAQPSDANLTSDTQYTSAQTFRNVTVTDATVSMAGANLLSLGGLGSARVMGTDVDVHGDLTGAAQSQVTLGRAYVGGAIRLTGAATATIDAALVNAVNLVDTSVAQFSRTTFAQSTGRIDLKDSARLSINQSNLLSDIVARGSAVVTLDGVYIDRNPHIKGDFSDKPQPQFFFYGNTVANMTNVYATDRTDVLFLENSTANLYSGILGNDLKLYGSAKANIYGGIVGDDLTLNDNSSLNFYGGRIVDGLEVRANNVANIQGGLIAGMAVRATSTVHYGGGDIVAATLYDQSTLNMNGGQVVHSLTGTGNSRINLGGGVIKRFISGSGQTRIHVYGHGFAFNPTGGVVNAGRLTGFWGDGQAMQLDYGSGVVNLVTIHNVDYNADARVDAADIGLLFDSIGMLSPTPHRDLTGDGAVTRQDVDWLVNFVLRTEFGDTNVDRRIDATDIDVLFAAVGAGSTNLYFDLNNDSLVSRADVDALVQVILGTRPGDVNLDGAVSIGDLTVLAENFGGPGGWAMGDLNGDGVVTIGDLTVMAEHFGQSGPPGGLLAPQTFAAVPAPAAIWAGLVLLAGLGVRSRRYSRGLSGL